TFFVATVEKLDEFQTQSRRHAPTSKKRLSSLLKQVNLYAAGIDVGATEHFVAVPEGLDDHPIRSFSCFTGDLERLADWLVRIGMGSVVMESTGVYWIPLFEMLEERGLEVLLVNARHVKNVTGRKSDVQDCQWLQQLHTYGLLSGAFRPPDQVVVLRTYMRQRDTLIRCCASHIQPIQKALRQMNLLLDNVVSHVTGKTGMDIIRAILSGERDPRVLAEYRNGRCKRSKKDIAKSLHGNYREEHLFSLKQAVTLYDFYQAQIVECDHALEQQLKCVEQKGDLRAIPAASSRRTQQAPAFNAREYLYRMAGVDLTQIAGISEITALKVLSETGVDMSRWRTEKHFASWLGLAPGNKISGGRILSSKTTPTANRAAQALRMAAYTLSNSEELPWGFLSSLTRKAWLTQSGDGHGP
ncbi:MAG: IS110 family transposase, partial [Methylococcales bacterium]|nr:IS110 family transposase [Methylococcales bacterium]